MTTVAQFRGREVSVNFLDRNTITTSKIFQFCNHLPMCEVLHFSSPQFCHTSELKVFYTYNIVFTTKGMCLFPLAVFSTIDDSLLYSIFFLFSKHSVLAVFFTAMHFAVCFFLRIKFVFKELRRLDSLAVRECHICLQSEVNADRCTIMCLSNKRAFGFNIENNIIFPKWRPFYCNSFYFTNLVILTRERKFISFLVFVYCQHIFVKRITTLFKNKCCKLFDFFKLWRSFLYMFKKTYIRPIKSFQYFLYCLRTKPATIPIPTNPFFLQTDDVNISMINSIVSFLQRKRMIPYPTSLAQHCINVFRLLGRVEFIFVCYHVLIINKGQFLVLLWLSERSHRDISVTRHFYYPCFVVLNLLNIEKATIYGGNSIPLRDFSDAKIQRFFGRNNKNSIFTHKNVRKKIPEL